MPEQDEPGQGEPEVLQLTRRLVDLSIERSQQSKLRSNLSAERSYMNAERTLSVWIRTALASMIVGMAIDRFRLFLQEDPLEATRADSAAAWVGDALVALGVLMVVVTAARFWLYARAYRRTYIKPDYHGAFMAPAFAILVGIFGLILLILLILAPA